MKKTYGWLAILCLAAFSMTDLNASKKKEAPNTNSNNKFKSTENVLQINTDNIINEFLPTTNSDINTESNTNLLGAKNNEDNNEIIDKILPSSLNTNNNNNNRFKSTENVLKINTDKIINEFLPTINNNINTESNTNLLGAKNNEDNNEIIDKMLPSNLNAHINNNNDKTTEKGLKKSDGNEMIKRTDNINALQINGANGHLQPNGIIRTDDDNMSISSDSENNNNIYNNNDGNININNEYKPVGNSKIDENIFVTKANNDDDDNNIDSNNNGNTQSNNNNVNNNVNNHDDNNIDKGNNNNKQPFYRRYSNAILGVVMFLLFVIVYKLFIIDKNAWGLTTKIKAHKKIPKRLKRLCLLKWSLT